MDTNGENLSSNLDDEEALLLKRLAEIKAQKEDEKRKAAEEAARVASTAPVIVLVEQVDEHKVFTSSSAYREDLVNAMRSIRSRWWDGTKKQNSFDLKDWPQVLDALAPLSGVEIKYHNGSKEELEKLLNRPHYHVDLKNESTLVVKVLPETDATPLYKVPGGVWNQKTLVFTYPINQTWLLYQTLAPYEKVLWEEAPLAIATRDLQQRAELDKIALMEDCELSEPLEKFTLKPFQRVTVKFLQAATQGAMVAHQMGLGKTRCYIAFCVLNKYKRNVIICKAALKVNWAREIMKLTGETPYVCSGTEPNPHDFMRLLRDEPRWVIINYDIVGRAIEKANEYVDKETQQLFRGEIEKVYPWIDLINGYQPDSVALDESHYIKNPDAARTKAILKLKAGHYVPITGTPVLNRPGELWPSLHLIRPDLFPSYEQFLATYTFGGKGVKNVDELRALLKPIMFRKTKKEVLPQLEPINRIYDWVELSEKARKMYDKVLMGLYESLAEWDPTSPGAEKAVTNMLVQMMRMKQIVSVDRVDYVAEKAVDLSDSNNGGKVLIFTQFKPIAKAIAKRLGHEAVCLTGDNPGERQQLEDDFKTKEHLKFFVATMFVAGEGLNLEVADEVIFADQWWTPALHQQCEERAYGRLSNPHAIDSYWIVATDTIDELIQKILERKMKVIESTIEGMDADRSASIANEVLGQLKSEMFRRKK